MFVNIKNIMPSSMDKRKYCMISGLLLSIVPLLIILAQLSSEKFPGLDNQERILQVRSRELVGKGCPDATWQDPDCWKDVALEDLPALPVMAQRCRDDGPPGGGPPRTLYATFTLGAWEKTYAHLASLSRVKEDIDLVVFDDGSQDQTLEKLKELGIKHVTTTKPPQGVTYVWNLAYTYFWAHCYDYLFMTNNDVLVPSGAFSKVLSALVDADCNMAGPLTTWKGAGRNAGYQAVNKQHPKFRQPEGMGFLERVARAGQQSEQNRDIEKLFKATQLVQDAIEKNCNSNPNADVKTVVADHPLTSINGFYFALRKDSLAVRFDDYHLLDPSNRNIRNEYDLQGRIVKEIDNARICIVRNAYVYHFKGSTIPLNVDREKWGKVMQKQRNKGK
mmetsp:Transcript_38698/g.50995  ORF Transcript_38698/g.50995 Transcript_38698/m.50995 type:complete len:390 (+) Transcript_38698:217-1386(+)